MLIEALLASYLITQVWAADAVDDHPVLGQAHQYCVWWSSDRPPSIFTHLQRICKPASELTPACSFDSIGNPIDCIEFIVPESNVPTPLEGDAWYFNITADWGEGIGVYDHGGYELP